MGVDMTAKMQVYKAQMMLAFFDSNDELMLRIDREYSVEALSPNIARASEVTKLTKLLCEMKHEGWNSVTFDVTIMKEGKEAMA